MSGVDTPEAAHCCCGVWATVGMGPVPDPGCPIHGDHGINAWSRCPDCGKEWRNVVGHVCNPPSVVAPSAEDGAS